jgi:tetratricopeptide (TPR) repeat protein
MEMPFHAVAVAVYALIGAFLEILYYASPRARQEPVIHLLTVLVIVLAVAAVGFAASIEIQTIEPFQVGIPFLLFAGASLLYLPLVIFLSLHYWEVLLAKLTSPGSTADPPREPRGSREQWQAIRSYLEALSIDPTNAAVHEKLGDLYARLGHWDAAAYQYRKAAEWLDHGYAQGHILYKTARILIEKKQDVSGSLVLLRRIVRLYPKSWFASYARRILSHWEARQETQDESRRSGQAPQG